MLIQEQGSDPRQHGLDATTSKSKVMSQIRSASTTSPRKVEANRRNSLQSTGPKSSEGKAKSSQNSITHGIFVTKFLNGATPEAVAQIEALVASMREHYHPVGILEEILMQKIVVEAARYDRVLGFEHQQLTRDHAFLISKGVDCIGRYTTSTSRALFRAIEELERVQTSRKARESSAVSPAAESAIPIIEAKEEQLASEVTNTVLSDNSAP